MHDGSEGDEAHEGRRQLVVARGDPTEVLDTAEEALDAVSLLVESRVVGVLAPAMASRRHDGVTALGDDLAIEPIGVIGLLSQDVLGIQAVDQIAGRGHVVLLAWTQDDANPQAQGVYADVDLGSEAAARAAKRLGVRSPLFRRALAAWA